MNSQQIANVVAAYMMSDDTTVASTDVLGTVMMAEIGKEQYTEVCLLLAPMIIKAIAIGEDS